MRRQSSIARAVGEGLRRVGVGQARRVEHLAGQGEGELDDVGGAAARQDLDGLAYFERVARGAGRAGWTCR